MAIFPPIHGPRAALKDLRAFLSRRSREQVIGGSLAILSTLIIVIVFLVDAKINTAPPRTIVYLESYPANRTDAEIIADQKKDQAKRDELRAQQRAKFKKLQDDLGIE